MAKLEIVLPPAPPAAPSIVLEPIAKERAPILHNLFELYVHDFSEYLPLEIQPSGRFEIAIEDEWWTRGDRFPFFVRKEGKLAGFALARRGSLVTGDCDAMDVTEFFVLRGLRRTGVGTCAAHALFATFPGRWEVRVLRTNIAAMKFWAGTIGGWAGLPVCGERFFGHDGAERELFRFDAPHG